MGKKSVSIDETFHLPTNYLEKFTVTEMKKLAKRKKKAKTTNVVIMGTVNFNTHIKFVSVLNLSSSFPFCSLSRNHIIFKMGRQMLKLYTFTEFFFIKCLKSKIPQ